MAWLRIDDTVPTHRKHLKAGPAAAWLWVCGIAYCQRHLTDGFIPEEALALLGVAKGSDALASKLVEVGLFCRVDGGYQVHDYLDLNASRDEAVATKQKRHEDKAKAGRAGAAARWQKDGSLPSVPDSTDVAQRNGETMAPSHPIPSPAQEPPVPSRPACALPEGRGNGVMAGMLPRDHVRHAACSPNFAWCVPEAVHAKFRGALLARFGDGMAAVAALQGWYAEVWASLPADTVIGDAFKFWQPLFDAKWAAAPVPTTGKGLNVDAIAAEIARQNAEVA